MDPKFSTFVTNELRVLLREYEAGQEPSNVVLAEKMLAELRRQFEREFAAT